MKKPIDISQKVWYSMYKERERPHKQARDLTRAGLRNGRETQYSFSGQIETWFLEALDPIDYREDVW